MELFTSAWDGDVEGVLHALESGASVNVTRPVSAYTTLISNNSTRNIKIYIYINVHSVLLRK